MLPAKLEVQTLTPSQLLPEMNFGRRHLASQFACAFPFRRRRWLAMTGLIVACTSHSVGIGRCPKTLRACVLDDATNVAGGQSPGKRRPSRDSVVRPRSFGGGSERTESMDGGGSVSLWARSSLNAYASPAVS